MKEIISIIVVVGGIMANTAFATNRYVVAAGTIANGLDVPPYNTWTNAATNIQWAVDVATNTETVWVSNGVYVLTNQIVITNAIFLRSTNGPDVTIVNGNYSLYTNRCLLMSNASAFVSGLTFSNGAINSTSAPSSGGGVLMYSGFLSNCNVRNNLILTNVGNSTVQGGGGICMVAGTTIACQVTGNIVSNVSVIMNGGGVYGGTVINCLISNNFVCASPSDSGLNANGGGVCKSTLVRGSLICSNRVSAIARYGSGVYITSAGILDSSTVTLNQADSATYGGSAIEIVGTLAIVTNCVISYNNTGAGWGAGGGINLLQGNAYASILNSSIYGNTYIGVYIANSLSGSSKISGCVITNNSGTGISISSGSGFNTFVSNCVVSFNQLGILLNGPGAIRNCLIANNTTSGLFIAASCKTGLVSGCTIVSNQSTSAGAGIRIAATNAADARLISVSSCIIYSNGVSGTNDVYDACSPININAIQYSCLGTNPGGYFTGVGIIVADPKFKDFAGGNYRLSSGSPCINAGSNENWMTNSVDLAGYTRLRFNRVDMGAYEWYPGIKINGVPFEKIRFINGTEPRWINGFP